MKPGTWVLGAGSTAVEVTGPMGVVVVVVVVSCGIGYNNQMCYVIEINL